MHDRTIDELLAAFETAVLQLVHLVLELGRVIVIAERSRPVGGWPS